MGRYKQIGIRTHAATGGLSLGALLRFPLNETFAKTYKLFVQDISLLFSLFKYSCHSLMIAFTGVTASIPISFRPFSIFEQIPPKKYVVLIVPQVSNSP